MYHTIFALYNHFLNLTTLLTFSNISKYISNRDFSGKIMVLFNLTNHLVLEMFVVSSDWAANYTEYYDECLTA